MAKATDTGINKGLVINHDNRITVFNKHNEQRILNSVSNDYKLKSNRCIHLILKGLGASSGGKDQAYEGTELGSVGEEWGPECHGMVPSTTHGP